MTGKEICVAIQAEEGASVPIKNESLLVWWYLHINVWVLVLVFVVVVGLRHPSQTRCSRCDAQNKIRMLVTDRCCGRICRHSQHWSVVDRRKGKSIDLRQDDRPIHPIWKIPFVITHQSFQRKTFCTVTYGVFESKNTSEKTRDRSKGISVTKIGCSSFVNKLLAWQCGRQWVQEYCGLWNAKDVGVIVKNRKEAVGRCRGNAEMQFQCGRWSRQKRTPRAVNVVKVK